MRPTLERGDWVLVDPFDFTERPPAAGELVVVPDPREPGRLLVKRVGAVAADGRLHLVGDASEASTDSRVFGPVDRDAVTGRPWFRYWPVRRLGPIR
jgi:nickel-type superoxide dismutase maturation protease